MADHTGRPIPAPPPLVGREREQAILRELLAAAIAGRGSLVLIGGEAGSGKTTLAEWLLAEAARQGALALVGRCYDLGETPPYGPWLEVVAQFPNATAGLPAPPAALLDRAMLATLPGQGTLFDQVLTWCAAVAAVRSLVLLLDDQHWADPASLDLLRLVARRAVALPLLLVVTYRSDELTRRHPLYALLPILDREAHATRLDVRRFDAAGVRALAEARVTLPAAESRRLVDWLLDRAEGHAFFTVQLLRALEEEGVLARSAAAWLLGDLGAVGLPAPLRQVLDARLLRLGEAARQHLALAAVIGQEVPLALWAALAGTDEDSLLDTIDRASDARLLTVAPDGGAVRFAHALIREAAYEGLLATRRRRVHRRAAEALAAGPRPDADAVAYHFRQAGDARAGPWLRRAGLLARNAFALQTARDHFAAALALLEREDADPGERGRLLFHLARVHVYLDPVRGVRYCDEGVRLAEASGARALLGMLLSLGGNLRRIVGQVATGLAELERGMALVEGLAEDEAAGLATWAARDGLPLPNMRGTVVESLGFAGHFARALALGEPLIAIPPPGPAEVYSRDAAKGLALAYAYLGRPEDARAAFATTQAINRALGALQEVGSTATFALQTTLLPYFPEDLAGRRAAAAEGEAAYARMVALSPAVGPPPLAGLAIQLLEGDWAAAAPHADAFWAGGQRLHQISADRGQLLRWRGDAAGAWALVRQRLPAGRATPRGATFIVETLPLLRLAAALALDAADLPEARAWLTTHDGWLAWSGAVLGQSEGEGLWACYHRLAGQPGDAFAHAERAQALATAPRQPLALLAARRLLGELATAAGQPAEAATHLEAALALAGACAAPYERALTLLALAELRASAGNRGGALLTLDEARAICDPLGARPALARADALTATLAATPARLPFGLTPREAEVLRLVAAGLDNEAVAARLFLSPRTVSTHLTSVYGKLGVAGRPAAIRLALDYGLR